MRTICSIPKTVEQVTRDGAILLALYGIDRRLAEKAIGIEDVEHDTLGREYISFSLIPNGWFTASQEAQALPCRPIAKRSFAEGDYALDKHNDSATAACA